MVHIEQAKNSNKDYIHQLLKDAEIDFPIVVKWNKAMNCNLAHSKYFIHDIDGLDNLYNDKDFMEEDLVAEELVPHSEELLIKVYCFCDKILFWRIDKSIPNSYFSSTLPMYKEPNDRLTKRAHESKCYENTEHVENEDAIDIKFLYKICTNLIKTINVNFTGFDFIVSTKDGS